MGSAKLGERGCKCSFCDQPYSWRPQHGGLCPQCVNETRLCNQRGCGERYVWRPQRARRRGLFADRTGGYQFCRPCAKRRTLESHRMSEAQRRPKEKREKTERRARSDELSEEDQRQHAFLER